MEHNKKVALVTGANRGIGYEITRQLGENNFTVVLTSRNSEKGIEAQEKLLLSGLDIKYHQLDVTNEYSINKIAEWIGKVFGVLDVLVNNAGVLIDRNPALQADINDIRKTMEINVYGVLKLIQALVPVLEKSSDARIINISSDMGCLSEMGPGFPGYRLSKASLNALTVILSHEFMHKNISINAVNPGWVKSDMGGANARFTVAQGADTAVWLAAAKNIPTGKFFYNRKIVPC
ncbi:MAG: SDR family oxidoreductase [Bacteroidales bacterium]|nr:SDR family oxidoreductase [Bacteroidales bacterium]